LRALHHDRLQGHPRQLRVNDTRSPRALPVRLTTFAEAIPPCACTGRWTRRLGAPRGSRGPRSDVPDGVDPAIVRAVTEKCRVLTFKSHGFEAE
jgi:hypothetical protein